MKSLARSLAMVSSFALLAVGCGEDQADDLTASEEALLTCDGFHHGDANRHRGHRHHRHHHHHGHGGSGGMGGEGGRPHLPPTGGTGGSMMGGSTGTAGSSMGGSTGGGGTGGGMVDPRCTDVSGIVSWWHGDGDYDDAVGSNDGMSAGAVSFVAGADGQGFGLNAATPGSFVTVPHDPSLMMGGTFTLDAWINPATLGGRIIDKATAGGLDGYMIDIAGPWLRLFIGDGGQVFSTSQLPISMFTHVAAVFDNGKMGVYINGVLDAEAQIGRLAPPPNTLPLRIGADSNGGSQFDGVIDEPRVFNRALTADEITLLYWQSSHCQ